MVMVRMQEDTKRIQPTRQCFSKMVLFSLTGVGSGGEWDGSGNIPNKTPLQNPSCTAACNRTLVVGTTVWGVAGRQTTAPTQKVLAELKC